MNKKERNYIYKTILEEYKIAISSGIGFCGICYILHILDLPPINKFKELRKQKPEKVFYNWDGNEDYDDSQFWFPVENTEIRIQLLERVIKETEDE